MKCEWSSPTCQEEATHVVRFGGKNHPICSGHAAPKMHPRDLRRSIHVIDEQHRPDCLHRVTA